MVLLFCSSGGPHPLVTPWHRICPRVSSQTKSPLTCSDFDFSPNSPDSPHIPTHHAQNGHGDNLAPTGYRLILFCLCQHWHGEGLSLCIRVRTSGRQGLNLKSVPCPAKSHKVPSSTTTAASRPFAKLVGGFLGPMDPGVST